jgi:hypothetical protein
VALAFSNTITRKEEMLNLCNKKENLKIVQFPKTIFVFLLWEPVPSGKASSCKGKQKDSFSYSVLQKYVLLDEWGGGTDSKVN